MFQILMTVPSRFFHLVTCCSQKDRVTYSVLAFLHVNNLMQGLSLSDVMFVTKRNMPNAVQSMSKQLEQVSSALAVCFVPNIISYLLQHL